METIGIAIIGCGWVAEEYIKAVRNDPRAEIRALVSRSPGKPNEYKARHGLDCAIETHSTGVVKRDDIHLVIVATPHDRHTPYVVEAADAGKHVIVEKPVALTRDEVRRQCDAVRRAGVKSLVGFVLHWNPLLKTVDHLIEQEVFGNIFMIEVDYFHRIWLGSEHWLGTAKQGGTSMLAAGCHAVDALRWFARSDILEVSAYNVRTENPLEYTGTTNAIVRFEDGKTGRVTSCFDAQMPYRFNIGIYGTEGTLRNSEIFAPGLFPGQTDFAKIPVVLPDSGDVAHHPFQGEVSHMLDCLEHDRTPFPDLDDAAHTMDVCFAADLSAESGEPVGIYANYAGKGRILP